MRSHYDADIDPGLENNSHSSILRMVGFNKRVLEAGCASGHVSKMLHAQGCSIVGVEVDANVVDLARPWLERVVIGDFDDPTVWDGLEGEHFEAVIFGDVLEHLKDPLGTLRAAVKHLVPSGIVVLSVPNIAHADVKIALLNGTFPYRDSGLLDQTHIHFFTKQSVLELVKSAGLIPTDIERVTVPVFATELGVERGDMSDDVLDAVVRDRESETYQFVIKASKDDGSRSLENLTVDLVALTDRLRDEQRRYVALAEQHAALQGEIEQLRQAHETQSSELSHLRSRVGAIKRVVPAPMLRFLARRLH
ncbi:MAG: methyltransferase domain-containing protein [Acidobacteria bacterium]|nr:methyltransferase domain-containing protein [Acidobacteriota bacterium]